jgi:hypothetical protein
MIDSKAVGQSFSVPSRRPMRCRVSERMRSSRQPAVLWW